MAVSGYLPPVVIQVMGDDAQFLKTITRDEALLKGFARNETKAVIGGDSVPLMDSIAKSRAELLAFARDVTDAKLGVDAAPFWSDITSLRAQLAALSPLDVNVDANTTAAMAQIAAMRGALALAQVDQLAGGAGGGGGLDVGIGGGGAGGNAGNAAAAWITWFHAVHLAMPEIVGLATALVAVGAGFAALAIAAGPSVVDIQKGTAAVDAAHSAISKAIPGTSQWTKGVQSLGQAWSQIPTALQPAVAAIHNMMSASAKSPATQEIQGWLGAQAQTLTKMFSTGGHVFEPLILATQRAIDTVEGMFSKMAGSGTLSHLVNGLARMVGPAAVELTQLAVALAQVATGFARAVTDGQGLEMLVSLVRSLGQIVNSSLMQGFIAGWVDFDRIISVALGLIAKVIGELSNLGVNMSGVGTALGFVASGFAAVKAVLFLLGKTGAASGSQLATFSSKLSGMLTKGAGIGLLAAGISGLAGNIATLLHTSNPLSGMWHAVAGALGMVSKGTTGAINTIKGYQVQLSGAIPITGHLSSAMDLLVRSEQSIGSSLGAMASGFAPLGLNALGAAKNISKVTDSIKTLEGNLAQSTSSTATWAADAQILIKKGMDPAAVASLAQQAPQDLASMATATTAQLGHMNVLWQEKMLEASMSGQKGIEGMIAKMRVALTSGTPVMKAAAAGLAKTLGATLNVPFTGSVASLDKIGQALQSLPVSVLQTLAGKTHQYSAAASDASAKTATLKAHTQSLGGTLLAMLPNLAMVAIGLKMSGLTGLVGRLGRAAGGMVGLGGAASDTAASVDAATAAAASSAAAVDGMGVSLASAGTDAAAAATGGIEAATSGFGAMLGPIGLAAGVLGTVLVPAFISLFHHGPSAAQQTAAAVKALNGQLSQIPVSNVYQMATALDKVGQKVGTLGKAMLSLKPGTAALQVAAGKMETLRSYTIQTARQMTTFNGNVQTLSKTFGISTGSVQSFASQVGINLKQKLDPTQVGIFSKAIQQSGQSFNKAATQVPHYTQAVVTDANKRIAVEQHANTTINSAAQTFAALHTAILQKEGAAGIAALVNGTKGGLPQVEAVAQQYGVTIPKKYLSAFQRAMQSNGKISIAKLASGITSGLPVVSGALSGLQRLNATAISQAGAQMHIGGQQIGASLGSGIMSAILAAGPAIVNAGNAMVTHAIASMRNAAKINSPSKLTMEVGSGLAEGLIVGMRQMMGMVGSTGGLLANSAIAPMTGARAGLGGLLGAGGATGPITVDARTSVVINGATGNPGQMVGQLTQALDQRDRQLIARLRAGTAY